MKTSSSRVAHLECFAALFVVAVSFNYFWEVAQGFLYVGMDWEKLSTWVHCLVASLGDGVLVWIIFAVGWFTFRRADWFVDPSGLHYSVMLIAGLSLGVVVEWIAVGLINRWAYTEQMPLIPGLAIGLVPVIQMIVLPPVIFFVVAAWIKQRAANSNQ